MRDIHVRPEEKDSTLLAEVDLLAGVSGGSFPAAHFGAKSFETFPDEFLYPDIEAYIWGHLRAAVELGLDIQSPGGHQ
jgi:NTE family protein